MIWLGVLTLFLVQAVDSAPSRPAPEAPGIYYLQRNADWVMLKPAVIADADAKGMDLFLYSGGYTDLGMNIACRGPRASIRIRDGRPAFHVRSIGSIKDAMLIRLTKKRDRRVFKTSFSNVTVENKGGFDKQDIFNLAASENPGGFTLSPEKSLPPGEYLLVLGNASKSYDFGIDKSK